MKKMKRLGRMVLSFMIALAMVVAMGAVALRFLFFRIRRKQRNSTCSPN